MDAAKAFDSIFSELEGLVRDTLKDSVDETFEAARVAEGELGAVRTEVARNGSSRPARANPAPVRELDPEEISEVVELPPITSHTPAPLAPPKGSAPPARGQRIATPPADVGEAPEDEDEEREPEASAAPYNWGVRPAKRPPGAWLLGEEGGGAPAPEPAPAPAQAPANPAAGARPRGGSPAAATPAPAVPAVAPAAAADAGAGGPVGGRGYLVKKLSDEVLRARPALRALQDRGLISAEDLGEAPGRPGKGSGDDDEVSIDHFEDRQEIDLEKELSPVRLVGELRKIRRLVDALVAKGLISPADLERAADE